MLKREKLFNKILFLKHQILLVSILLLSFFLRFANFQNRWDLSYDQARDLLVSGYALSNHLIPLIGPFSSAGKFVYGPQWFWILESYIGVNPSFFLTPWIIHCLIWVGMTLVMYLMGKELINKYFGLLLAFLFSTSWPLVHVASNLISPSMVGIFSIISLYFFVRLIKYSKILDSFLLGFFVANTVNIHFQAIGLLVLLPVGFLFGSKNLKNLLALIGGFFIPFIPMVIFELKTNFFESRNLLDYYLYGQYRIYVPNRWLTYAGVFWPRVWALVIGVQTSIGYLFIALMAFISAKEIFTKKIDKKMLALIISFLTVFIMLRYYKGELFDNYIIFLYPFVLIFSSWVLLKIFKFNKILAIIFFIIITSFNLNKNIGQIQAAKTPTGINIENFKNQIEEKYPNDKFAVYLYKYNNSSIGLPIVLYLRRDNKISDTGKKIGIDFDNNKLKIITLTKINKDWVFINPSAVYKSVANWYSK